jgi:hypothetical protein
MVWIGTLWSAFGAGETEAAFDAGETFAAEAAGALSAGPTTTAAMLAMANARILTLAR